MNNSIVSISHDKILSLNDAPKTFAAKVVPGTKFSSIHSEQLEKMKMAEVVDGTF